MVVHSLKNRSAVITGASQGLGLAIANAYVEAGANVMLCGRDPGRLERARLELASMAAPGQTIASQVADVSVRDDVDRVVDAALNLFPRLHVLVNNAGVYGPKGLVEGVDWEEWAQAVAVNLLGSVLMCRAVLPHFRTHHYGKIVQLSGGGATTPLPRISAYAVSKAGIVRFVETLAEEARDDHVDVNAIAPGALNTRLLDEVLEAGPERVGKAFYAKALAQRERGGTPLTQGARLAVFLGSAASDGISGRLISAVWDRWEDLPRHRDELQGSDVYTLRRIVPRDRGMAWGDR
jgi:NAD(P)-dependent dehydrogenase (short-subunit alcohol dehydrogenase family)